MRLGFINALHCPQYHSKEYYKDRRLSLKKIMQKTSGVAIAIDDCCAMEIVDDQYRVISSRKDAHVYKVYWKRGKFYEEMVEQKKSFEPLEILLKKINSGL